MRTPGQTQWVGVDGPGGYFYAELVAVPLRWWERAWFWLRPWKPCRVYWGSHGCEKRRGHRGHHECDCCECPNHARDHIDEGCVATHPYYGSDTRFFGEDAS